MILYGFIVRLYCALLICPPVDYIESTSHNKSCDLLISSLQFAYFLQEKVVLKYHTYLLYGNLYLNNVLVNKPQ